MLEVVFGTRDWCEIESIIDGYCARHLDAGLAEVLFRAFSVGVVIGVRLDDNRRVVIKVHQPRERVERLWSVHDVQADLYRVGFPCPKPVAGPAPLGHGYAVAEALLDRGEFRNTHEPGCRQLIAEALAWHLSITAATRPPAGLVGAWNLFTSDRLWPSQAHSPVFDFDATSAGAEWIDQLAAHAKDQITSNASPVVGHCDWSGKHFRFADQNITAVYDWDSLAVCPETAIVGVAAISFTTRFDLPGVPRAPSRDEMTAFIDEYAAARGAPFQADDRRQITAHALLLAAYTARCEHCAINNYDAGADPYSFTAALRQVGRAYLNG